MTISREEWKRLSVPERIQLVEDIWDSIADDAESMLLMDAQRADLEQRVKEYKQEPSATKPWAQVREELERDE
jgi:putative addiction module component (TIGR02574 family)